MKIFWNLFQYILLPPQSPRGAKSKINEDFEVSAVYYLKFKTCAFDFADNL